MLWFHSAATSTAACKRPTRGSSILDASAARHEAAKYSPLLKGGVLTERLSRHLCGAVWRVHASWPHEEKDPPRSGPPAAQRCCFQSRHWRQRRDAAAYDTNLQSRGRSSSCASHQSRVRGRHGCECRTLRPTQHSWHCVRDVPCRTPYLAPIVLFPPIAVVVVTAVVARPVERPAAHRAARLRSGGPATCTPTLSLTVVAVTYVVRERNVLLVAASGRAASTEQQMPRHCRDGRCRPVAMSKENAARVLPHTPSGQHTIPFLPSSLHETDLVLF